MKKSCSLTGRKANSRAWVLAEQSGGCFVVGAYTTFRGETMYAEPVYTGSRKGYGGVHKIRPGTRCRYRVIVTPKQPKPCDAL
jgi:hypothetical protein